MEPYTGHAEVWSDASIDAPPPAPPPPNPSGDRGVVIEDEAIFIDFSRSANFLAKEWEFFDRR